MEYVTKKKRTERRSLSVDVCIVVRNSQGRNANTKELWGKTDEESISIMCNPT